MLVRRIVLFAFASSALVACTGPEGPQGPPGGSGGTGSNGQNGQNALTRTTPEPPGANCPDGGTKIEVGLDANGNGVLDDSEVVAASTTYVCNGTGTNSLVRTSAEPNGANCPYGGVKIETGLDANNNGVLDDSEVNAAETSYVCNLSPGGSSVATNGINITYKSVSTTSPITVRFVLKDDKNFPLDLNGSYSVNTPIQPRFAIGWFSKDATTGFVGPLTVYTKSTSAVAPAGQPTSYNPLAATGQGTLVENGLGAGDYTYTFPTTSITNGPQAVAYDATKLDQTHVVWIQATRQTDLVFPTDANTFFAANQPYYYIPSGTGTPLVREIAAESGCDSCHAKFKAETVSSAAFHGGGRVNVGMCNVCHNPGRTTNLLANSSSFIHRIHNGENVAPANLFHGIAATYPKDIRDCNTCHANAAQGSQALANPSQLACGGCHDYVSFTGGNVGFCGIDGQLQRDSVTGLPVPCNHVGGPVTDQQCATCHGPSGSFPVQKYHQTVASPDPNNIWQVPSGGNPNTNASYVAANGLVPTGSLKVNYVIKSVDVVTDAGGVKRPQITFKLQANGTDVVFQTYVAGTTTEIMPNVVGSPSVYWVFATTQDGNATPADFNAAVSGYIRNIWNGTASGTGAGTLTGPDSSGFYTIRMTGVTIPADATMVTGGVGYGYSLSSSPPLVQTNLPLYPCVVLATNQVCSSSNVTPDGKVIGGLSVPAPDVTKVATGYTGRRQIVDNAKCDNCHGALGANPTFHAGQRNDGPTCSWCHNPNRTSSGWAAGSKYFIHAIHAGRKRVVPFTWHAAAAGPGYDEVEFPGTLNSCTTCHVPNTFDFTNPTNLAAVPNMLLETVATGVYSTDPKTNSTYYTVSPYVVADGLTSYGAGFAYSAAAGTHTDAAGTTLVMSPITTACSSCHDTTAAIDHMTNNGGLFYATRTTAMSPSTQPEQCLLCHGPGRIAAIGVVHQH
jgi:OmcA/MtrC family decaheme c-type cytochrome